MNSLSKKDNRSKYTLCLGIINNFPIIKARLCLMLNLSKLLDNYIDRMSFEQNHLHIIIFQQINNARRS